MAIPRLEDHKDCPENVSGARFVAAVTTMMTTTVVVEAKKVDWKIA